MTPPRILIAGIGNIFLGDDAFGSEVARRLAARPMPDGVQGGGLRHPRLRPRLCAARRLRRDHPRGCDTRGGAPGTLYVIEPDPGEARGPEDADLLIQTTAWIRSRSFAWRRPWAVRPARAPRRLRARDDRHRRGPGHGAERAVEAAVDEASLIDRSSQGSSRSRTTKPLPSPSGWPSKCEVRANRGILHRTLTYSSWSGCSVHPGHGPDLR